AVLPPLGLDTGCRTGYGRPQGSDTGGAVRGKLLGGSKTMTFDDILKQVITLVKRQGRVSYGALKRRFDLDDAYLEDLKGEILYVHEAEVEADERGFTWTGVTEDFQETTSQSDRTEPQSVIEQAPTA